MIILGIEASAKVAGAAVYKDGMVVASEHVNATLTHSETLMPMISSVMQKAGTAPEELCAVALSAGPGSFTGLRIGAATAKGLADALSIPLLPVSTLKAIAANIGPTDALIVPMMDARRSQVYAAVYAYDAGRTQLITVEEPEAVRPEDLAAKLQNKGRVILLGDGAPVYAAKMQALLPEAVLAPGHLRYASPDSVAYLGACAYEKGETVPADQLQIDYLRKPQAEREREERLKAEGEGQA